MIIAVLSSTASATLHALAPSLHDALPILTGAASGMGLAFAHKFAEEGMSVVLADIEAEALSMAEAAVKAHGGKVAAVRTNVRSEEHTSELQSPCNLVCRLLLEKKKDKQSV